MTTTLPPGFVADRAAVTEYILSRRGTKYRRSGTEVWLDHFCLFHPDIHEISASWQEETGVYFCFAESRTYTVPEVLRALALDPTPSRDNRGRAPVLRPLPAEGPITVYTYRFPDGRPSHLKIRWGDGPGKHFKQSGPDGTPESRTPVPRARYPIFVPLDPAPGLTYSILVVEGEKAAETLAARSFFIDEHPLLVISAGSSSETKKAAPVLREYIQSLKPHSIHLWPDADGPGQEAMEAVALELTTHRLIFQMVPLDALEPPVVQTWGADDWLAAGGQIWDALRVLAPAAMPSVNGHKPFAFLDKLIVTVDQEVVFPGTRKRFPIDQKWMTAIHYAMTGEPAKGLQATSMMAELHTRSAVSPSVTAHRSFATPDALYWRPRAVGGLYRVDAEGVALDDDPEGVFITMPGELDMYPADVDLSGTRDDLVRLCTAYGLAADDIAMVEAALVCGMTKLQTPITFIRAPSGTGKTTLAFLLAAIIEPLGSGLDLKGERADLREQIRAIQQSAAMVLDNVSTLSGRDEDLLSRLVTGHITPVRALYRDTVVMSRVTTALFLTTVGYDIRKGDLASRVIVLEPSVGEGGYLSDRRAKELYGAMLPRVRGYIMHCCARFYAEHERFENQNFPIRIGDLGLVLACLGYDVEELARKEEIAKTRLLSQNDSWWDAVLQVWDENGPADFWLSNDELRRDMERHGADNLPGAQSPMLFRYLNEKLPQFKGAGFQMVRLRKSKSTGWAFSKFDRRAVSAQQDLIG
jgi:hypothetical protein